MGKAKWKRRKATQIKNANPDPLRGAAPSKGRGSRYDSLLPLEGGGAKRRRLAGLSVNDDQRASLVFLLSGALYFMRRTTSLKAGIRDEWLGIRGLE